MLRAASARSAAGGTGSQSVVVFPEQPIVRGRRRASRLLRTASRPPSAGLDPHRRPQDGCRSGKMRSRVNLGTGNAGRWLVEHV